MSNTAFCPGRRLAPALGILALPLAVVLTQPTPSAARDFANGIVNSKTKQGYAFMSGGVGTEERNLMQRKAGAYDLDLSFANRRGQYLSDVKVIIDDQHGKQLVDTTTTGPLFYIELPPGKYDVKASFDDKTREIKDLNVAKNHSTKELLHWNVPETHMS
jgi:hypothetical protein